VGGVRLPSHCAVHLDGAQDALVENDGGTLVELLMLQACPPAAALRCAALHCTRPSARVRSN
jgi:hypothetical protein